MWELGVVFMFRVRACGNVAGMPTADWFRRLWPRGRRSAGEGPGGACARTALPFRNRGLCAPSQATVGIGHAGKGGIPAIAIPHAGAQSVFEGFCLIRANTKYGMRANGPEVRARGTRTAGQPGYPHSSYPHKLEPHAPVQVAAHCGTRYRDIMSTTSSNRTNANTFGRPFPTPPPGVFGDEPPDTLGTQHANTCASPYSSNRNDFAANSMYGSLSQRKRDIIQHCTEVAQRAGKPLLFGMTTSLMLQAVPLPSNCAMDPDRLHTVSSSKRQRMHSLRGLVQPHVWTLLKTARNVRINQYVYALDLFHTWAQMATHLPLRELVILGESIIAALDLRTNDSATDFGGHIRSFIALSKSPLSFHGKKKCQTATGLMIPGARSPKESESHLLLRSHGIPHPILNYHVPDSSFKTGAPMTLDMAWPDFLVAVEYDGDQHRTDREQWRRDQEKRNRLRARGWEIILATAGNLGHDESRAEFAFLVARTLERGGAHVDFRVTAMTMEELARYESSIAARRARNHAL
ncbi:endonuclease domain-containing protein [Bifidobacterium olomucense]|uniref:endonuclease domain-containing protein n=1 Tax=Bifidobacterium olomucense TaxID=2675324 RepID=UPI001F0EC7B4|nr:hypothetical protein [Bifidobacterium sp. DSM 109959]